MPAWATILLFAVFVVSVIVFPAVEKRTKHLLIPMAFFRDRTFTVKILTASILGGAQMAFEVYFPMWLQAIYRLSASLSGLCITPSSLLWVGVSFFMSMLMRRFSSKHLAIDHRGADPRLRHAALLRHELPDRHVPRGGGRHRSRFRHHRLLDNGGRAGRRSTGASRRGHVHDDFGAHGRPRLADS
ncbi:MAG: hypothetical protein IKE32_04290 [Aeriscardovia sp.]|nr:hypothetical protein [Aeriscardovia sp.]